MKTVTNRRYAYIELKDLSTEIYQRPIDILSIKKKVQVFDEMLLGTITVSYRDGKYNVIDGQHRTILCKAMGIRGIMALIYEGLSLEEEAKYFNALNGANGESKRINNADAFNANIVAQDESSLDIQEAIESAGLKLNKRQGFKTIASYGTVTKLYRQNGKAHLGRTLKLIADTWGGETYSLNNHMLIGVAEFLKVYSEVEAFSEKTFIKQLSKIEPSKIVREIKADTTTTVTKVKAMNSLFKYYNSGLRKNILENMHFALR